MSSEWSVEGYFAKNKSEYEAFLRDSKKISSIKARLDLTKPSNIEKLYSTICTGGIKFESKLGFDFEDEITEKYENNLKKSSGSKNKTSSSKKRIIKEDDDFDDSDYINSRKKVEEFDENVDKDLVEYYIEKQRKRKNTAKFAIIAVALGVVVLSLFMVGLKVLSDKRSENVKEQIEESKKDNAFVFTTIKPVYNTTVTYDTYEIPDILPDYKDAYDKNNDLVGWITIADTHIDYPVVQGKDNEYYLSHNFNGKNDANGCIFVDMNCSIYPRSKNIIIYGHHMKSGKMFANLEKYDSYDFFTKHRKIVFDTIYEKAEYEVIFVFRDYVHASDDTDFKYYEFVDVNSETEFNSYMDELREKSIFSSNAPVTMDDELLTLSTCDYMQANGRFVVMAKKIK